MRQKSDLFFSQSLQHHLSNKLFFSPTDMIGQLYHRLKSHIHMILFLGNLFGFIDFFIYFYFNNFFWYYKFIAYFCIQKAHFLISYFLMEKCFGYLVPVLFFFQTYLIYIQNKSLLCLYKWHIHTIKKRHYKNLQRRKSILNILPSRNIH